MMKKNKALVIGGGGIAGIAWATGLLYGLEEAGARLRAADRLVGTSAGAVVTAQLTGKRSLKELYENQIEGTVQELPGSLKTVNMIRMVMPLITTKNTETALQKIGKTAAATDKSIAAARKNVIAERLAKADWDYDRDLRITAIDIELGRRRVFQAGGPANLIEAVTASCAVPGVWPVVEIDDHLYMDGGILSLANIDLAEGASNLVVIAPMVRGPRKEYSPKKEFEEFVAQDKAIEKTAVFISPDHNSKTAFGKNPLDPNIRGKAAEAGLKQAKKEAPKILAAWNG